MIARNVIPKIQNLSGKSGMIKMFTMNTSVNAGMFGENGKEKE
jgi:hypothetical protein